MYTQWFHMHAVISEITDNSLFVQDLIRGNNKETPKRRVIGQLWRESTIVHLGVDFPHQRPVRRNALPCHDDIMETLNFRNFHMFEARMLQYDTCVQFAQQPWEQSERSHQQIAYKLVNGCRPVCLNRLAILQGPRRLFRHGSWASRDDQHDSMLYWLWYLQRNCSDLRLFVLGGNRPM